MLCLRRILIICKMNAFSSHSHSTIYALSSGQGKCGVAVIRVTGPRTSDAVKSVAGFSEVPQPRYAYLRSLRNTQNGEIIDKGLVLWFPGPRSFTGEDSCEFQVHGGLAVINGIFDSLSRIPTFRIAEPGEFTKRAFSNGKLDLTEVEGLADLLNAETEIQRKQAFLQAQGFLSKIYNQWKEYLSNHLAHIEAHIDFEESENLNTDQGNLFLKNVMKLKYEIERHLLHGDKGEILRHGVKTVILGQPNVGKSSLLNLLCGRPAAIVTPISGTTRDVLEVRLDISGYPLILVDTAGLRKDSTDPIECEGMKRAVQQLDEADLVILMIDATDFSYWLNKNQGLSFADYLRNYLVILGLEESYSFKNNHINKPTMFVMNKTDLCSLAVEDPITSISCKTEEGIENFISTISQILKEICGVPSKEHPAMNKARHRAHLEDCLKELNMFVSKADSSAFNHVDEVILAEHLRRASRHLGKLVGSTTTDELLDIIFRDFCIGK